jgi:hypothetical protein
LTSRLGAGKIANLFLQCSLYGNTIDRIYFKLPEKQDGIPSEKQEDSLSDKQENSSLEKNDGIPSEKEGDSL